jgi:SAM-dependent methyltransferase
MIESNRYPHYLISDLTLTETIEHLGDFDFTQLIPHNAKVLNCGSGVFRTMERDLLNIRPDLDIVSIDPSLGIFTPDRYGCITTQGYQIYINTPHGVAYEPVNNSCLPNIARGQQAIVFDAERKAVITRFPGTVGAEGTHLPFVEKLFDVIMDIRGPMLYLKQNFNTTMQYFLELKRVLNPNGFILAIFLDPIQKRVLSEINMNYNDHTPNAITIHNKY